MRYQGDPNMFRQEEVFLGGWHEKTIESMQRRRFEAMIARLPPLGTQHLEALSQKALIKRIERCWQDIEIKPMRSQLLEQIRKSVLESVAMHADCLSREEHNLLERALILGGSARIEDAVELEAAQALSMRLWASVGIVSGKPYIELERMVMKPAAMAIAREEHEHIRGRFEALNAQLSGMLYRFGAMDDRLPQQMVLREVLKGDAKHEAGHLLARRYLWSSFDCMDYGGGVMLLHPALADPRALLAAGRRRSCLPECDMASRWLYSADILPEEIPLQEALERAIAGVMRDGRQEKDVARTLRFLCKQGAPLSAMEEVLQSSVIVLLSLSMRSALEEMYYLTPKWIEAASCGALQ